MPSFVRRAAGVRVLSALLVALAATHSIARAQQGPYDSRRLPRLDIAVALDSARADHKLVLLDFGANWCLDCVVLSRLFDGPTVHPYLVEHFHVVLVDVGNFDRNLDVAKDYGSPIEGGIPAVVVLSPSGEMIASTKDGALESARSATAPQILGFLQRWVAIKR